MYSIGISVFGYENKEKHSIYISKKCSEEKHVGSLLVGEAEKILYSCQRYQYVYV